MGCGASSHQVNAETQAANPRCSTKNPNVAAGSRTGPEANLSNELRSKSGEQPASPQSASAILPSSRGGASVTPVAEPALPGTVRRGISLRGLRQLREALQAELGAEYGVITTNDVNEKWVKPRTKARRCRLADMPEWVDPANVGVPMYFISHAWKNRFALLLDYVFGFLAAASDETRVWIDIFAVNQNADSEQQKEDVDAFSDVVQACKAGTIVVMDVANCNPASRAWCIFEWAHTLSYHGPDGLHLELRPTDRRAVYQDLDVARAECFFQKDKEMIMQVVETQHGSPQAFNTKLRLQLLLEPLSYSVDVNRLLQGGAAAGWCLDAILGWLRKGPAAGPRALCLAAGMGEGKSTISAALLSCGAAAPHGSGGAAAGDGGGGPLSCQVPDGATTGTARGATEWTIAAHFVKYNDQRRLEPVRIIKSLAFQLAMRSPPVCRSLLSLDAAKVSTLTDVEDAFELLLLEPLRAHQDAGGEQVILLLDAIDEADPPDEQLAATEAAGGEAQGQAAGQEGDASSPAAAVVPTAPLRVPRVCGNSVLSLLNGQLTRLPACVRFILTTRPEAAARQVLPSLRRTFSGGDAAITDPDVAAAASSIEPTRGGSDDDDDDGRIRSAGLLELSLGQLKHPAAAVAAGRPLMGTGDRRSSTPDTSTGTGGRAGGSGASSAVGGPGGVDGEVMLCYSVGELCHELGSAANDQAAKAAAVPFLAERQLTSGSAGSDSGGPSPAASSSRADGGCGADGVNQGRSGGRRAAAGTAVALESLYGHIVRVSYSKYDSSTTARRVSDLLAVLLVAREPLSESFLVQLGLGPLLPSLPGWGSLFFSTAHHVYMLHKSLSEFLLRPAGRLATRGAPVDLRTGHLTMARHLVRHRAASNSYCLKYLSYHLVAAATAAAAGCGQDAGESEALRHPRELLDEVMADFDFLARVLAGGHGSLLVSALGSLPSELHTGLSSDVLRWLLAGVLSWVERMQGRFAVPVGGADLAVHVLGSTPVGCRLHGKALECAAKAQVRQNGILLPWRPPQDDWPSLSLVLQGCSCVTWSPDGRQLASSPAAAAKHLDVWDAVTGQHLARLRGHTDMIARVAWGPDGSLLATGSADTTVRLWDAATGQCVQTLRGHTGHVWRVSWRPDGRLLASTSNDSTLRLWDVSTGAATAVVETGVPVPCLAWSPDGGRLAYGRITGTEVYVMDMVAAAGRQQPPTTEWAGHSYPVTGLAWSPDGRTVASGGMDNTVRLWDASTGQCLAAVQGHQSPVTGVSFSPDGARLATAEQVDRVVKVWELPALRLLRVEPADLVHTIGINVLQWCPTGQRLVRGSGGAIMVWDLPPASPSREGDDPADGGKPRAEAPASGDGPQCVAWSPDGQQLVSGCRRVIRLWDALTGSLVHQHPAPTRCVAWSPDCGRVASGTYGAPPVDGPAGDPAVGEPAAASECGSGGGAGRGGSESPAPGSPSAGASEVQVRDASSWATLVRLRGHAADVTSVEWSRDGSRLASGSLDGNVRVWDVAIGQCTASLSGHTSAITCLAWSGDGSHLASGDAEGDVRVWSCTVSSPGAGLELLDSGITAATTATFRSGRALLGHSEAVWGVSWSADDRQLSSGSDDGTIRVWEATSGECVAVFSQDAPSGELRAEDLNWRPDNKLMGLGLGKQRQAWMLVWDLAAVRHRTAELLTQGRSLSAVAMRPDGMQMVTTLANESLARWYRVAS